MKNVKCGHLLKDEQQDGMSLGEGGLKPHQAFCVISVLIFFAFTAHMFKHGAINKCLILWWVKFMEDYLSSGSSSSDGGNAESTWVLTVGNCTVPWERLGPGESLCDDQRWSWLASITLILHPLQETNGDSIKTTPCLIDRQKIYFMTMCRSSITLLMGKKAAKTLQKLRNERENIAITCHLTHFSRSLS